MVCVCARARVCVVPSILGVNLQLSVCVGASAEVGRVARNSHTGGFLFVFYAYNN